MPTPDDQLLDQIHQDAHTLLMGLLSNELVGVYVIQDKRFVYVNDAFEQKFGYSRAELCGGMGPLDVTDGESRELAGGEISARLEGRKHSSHYAFRAIRKDGSHFDVEVFGVATSFLGKPAIIGILLDVEQRVSAEKALQDQFVFVAQLMEAIPSPFFYKDSEGRYLGCNRAFEQFLGSPREAFLGRSVFDLSPHDLAERYHAADQALFDNPGSQTYESQIQNASGERRSVIFNKATFHHADGSLGGLVGVILDITERKEMEARIWHEANYDALTGLPNRRLFNDRLTEECKRARRNGESLALLFVDLDRFKEVNDTLGHRIGDALLVEASLRIRDCLRATDTVARQGGDEFLVLLPGITLHAVAGQVASKIVAALAEPFHYGSNVAYVSASVGIALYPEDTRDEDTLLSFADQAMYAAKAQGRNGFSPFRPALRTEALERLEMGNDLRGVLARDELQVVYQPIVDLASGEVFKAEALLRWRHPERGPVPPDRFIPVAEEIGLIGEIGDWVFRQALATARRCSALRPERTPMQISVNKSPRQFNSGGRHSRWLDFLRDSGQSGECLAVEITEGLLLDERPEVLDKLLSFRRTGMQISLDDFGTGYSALSYLKKFPIDILKIDRAFIRDIITDPSDRAIVEAIIMMAHRLDIRVVAEGVETEEQRRLLLEAGCDYAQGYYFARPMPADELLRFIAPAPEPGA